MFRGQGQKKVVVISASVKAMERKLEHNTRKNGLSKGKYVFLRGEEKPRSLNTWSLEGGTG